VSEGTSRPSRWWPLAISVAAFVAYLPALRAGFVFDDHVLVEGNRFLRGPLTGLWLTSSSPDFWPLTWTALWAEWRLFGEQAFAYHLVNVALHAGVAVLFFVVLRRLGVRGAALAGLLFAVHPVTVESVAWISEQKNTLSAIFFECTVLAWLTFEEGGQRRYHLLALGFFALALLSKASVVMTPLVLAGISMWRRRLSTRRTILALVPLLALSILVGLVNVWFQTTNAMAGGAGPARGMGERLGGAAFAFLAYLQKAFVPVKLALVYPSWPWTADSPFFFVPLVVLALLAALAAFTFARSIWARAMSLAVGYHAIQVLPVLGLVDMAYLRIAPMADHLQYLALMGPVALVGAGCAAAASRYRRAAMAGAIVLAAICASLTFVRASTFRDDLTLFSAAVRDAPESVYARSQLAAEFLERGEAAQAAHELEVAASFSRNEGDQHRLRAMSRLYSGHPREAVEEARAAVRAGLDPELRRDAAVVMVEAGSTAEAIPLLEALTREAPGSSDYSYWLAAAVSREGRMSEAVELLRAWCRERPGHPRMEQALALLLVRLGRVDEAREHAAAELDVDPRDPRAQAHLEEWIRAGGGH
jgi:protein O-mannosyl-transferase